MPPGQLQGDQLLSLIFLEENGLLQGVQGSLGKDCRPDDDGYIYVSATEVPAKNDLLLRIKSKSHLRMRMMLLTRVGREISAILPKEGQDVYLRAVAEQLRDNSDSLELCIITGKNGDRVNWIDIETIKADSNS